MQSVQRRVDKWKDKKCKQKFKMIESRIINNKTVVPSQLDQAQAHGHRSGDHIWRAAVFRSTASHVDLG